MKFAGDSHKGESFLHKPEVWFRAKMIPLVPKWIETNHLTLMTIIWSILVIVFGFLALDDIRWLWGVCALIVVQYITDILDGQIGKVRNTGLVKWGYYMDHFLDYVFICAMLSSLFIVLPTESNLYMLAVLVLFGSFMVSSFLSFSAKNEFQITYAKVGPTELRILFILVFVLLIFLGPTFMVVGLPYFVAVATLVLIGHTYIVQKSIWKIDMDNKKRNEGEQIPKE